MWIALGIVAFVVLLITVICLLPVKIIIQSDREELLTLRYKFLFKTFGEDPDPDAPIVAMLKKLSGVDRLEKEALGKSVSTGGLKRTVSGSYSVLVDLLKELVRLLKRCTVTRLHVYIRCGSGDAAETAISYGQCCAATDVLLNVLNGFLTVRRRGCSIDIGCDFCAEETVHRCEMVLAIRFFRVLAAFWRVVLAEAKRSREQQTPQQK